MQFSKSGLQITKQFEGCRLTSYQDPRGIWTIGYGHTAGIGPGMTITQNQADDFLMEDIQTAVNAVNSLVDVDVPLNQNEFDALVDFCFNVGAGNFANSTLLKLLNQGDYAGAAAQFDNWDYAGGVQLAGLLRRRQAETDEFDETPSSEADQT